MPDTVTIAGAAGAWGDSSLSTPQLLADGRADYVVYEALAEVTMAILARAHARDPAQGHARDIIETIAANLVTFHDHGMKVVTNAGGVNPSAAADIIRASAARADLDLRVATVTGDDLRGRIDDLRERDVREMDTGAPVPTSPLALHAYLGARPIAAALDAGADVVVTGRVVDSALALGPLVHEFGWGWDDHDLLSAGSLAGHLVECGPQATGGLMTDWEDTGSWVDPGFPLAIVRADGHTTMTTPEASDGLVDVRTVTEQLLYEIGDPGAYLLPDVTCDWRHVRVRDVGANLVEVVGARGRAPGPTLKACAHVVDGSKTTFLLFVGGRDAPRKARRIADDLLARGGRMLAAHGFEPFRATSVEVLGAESTYGDHARRDDTREVVLALGVAHARPEAVAAFMREVPSIGLGGPPGVSGGGTGLPRVAPVVRLANFLVPRDLVDPGVEVDGDDVALAVGGDIVEPTLPDIDPTAAPDEPTLPDIDPTGARQEPEERTVPDHSTAPADGTVEVPLIAVAHGRSGDKGAHVNIGLRARHPDFLAVLATVTADTVGSWLAHLGATSVQRWELPGIDAVNFLLRDGLGTASAASLRFDPQGKAVAQQLLDMPVALPAGLHSHPALRLPASG